MCSIQTIAIPRAFNSRMMSTSSFASASVKPPPISSSSRTAGPVASARASSSRFRSMSPSVSARRLATDVMPVSASDFDRRLIGAFMLEPAAMRGGGEDILEHRHAAEGPRNLVRARQPPPASLRRRREGDVLAEKAHPPAGRRMRADQQAEQGCLARAVRPDDAHRFAGADGKVDPVEHHEGAEAFRQAFRLEQKAVRSRAGRHAPRPVSC